MCLLYGLRIPAEVSFVLSQFTHLTERQTDRRMEISWLIPPCIIYRVVKICGTLCDHVYKSHCTSMHLQLHKFMQNCTDKDQLLMHLILNGYLGTSWLRIHSLEGSTSHLPSSSIHHTSLSLYTASELEATAWVAGRGLQVFTRWLADSMTDLPQRATTHTFSAFHSRLAFHYRIKPHHSRTRVFVFPTARNESFTRLVSAMQQVYSLPLLLVAFHPSRSAAALFTSRYWAEDAMSQTSVFLSPDSI